MRIGITGSSGFIGRSLLRALDERGDDVVRFVRPDSSAVTGNTIRWDPAKGTIDDGDLRRAGGFDAVINLAGAGIADKRWTPDRKLEILNSRTKATSLLVEGLHSMNSGVGVLASGSAIGYYGSRGDEVLDETSTPGTDFLADVVTEWERAALPFAESGTTVALLRTGIVMDKSGGALKKQLPLFRFGVGGPLSSGHQWLSQISLRDEVRAIIWTIDHKIAGPVNLVSPEPLTNSQFTKVLAHEIHRPAFVRVPGFALKIALGEELVTGAVLASQRVLPKILADKGFSFENPSAESILSVSIKS
jgi:uncharacterized protein (TIGR01777 family)